MTTETAVNGVPFIALPPEEGPGNALVLLWHGADEPNSPESLAAAMPLRSLPAWRVYLGLPLCGTREPEGGLFALFAEDAVTRGYHPIITGAVAELPAAVQHIRKQHGIDPGLPLGLFGFSMGGAAALVAAARGVLPVKAVATFGPMIDVGGFVDVGAKLYNMTYEWTPERRAFADEISSTGSGPALGAAGTAVLLAAGAEDPFPASAGAQRLAGAVRAGGGDAEVSILPGIPHGFGEEAHARMVDDLVAGWFRRRLLGG